MDWVASPFLLQGIFLTQGLNPGLPHCRQIPYHLSHQGREMEIKTRLMYCTPIGMAITKKEGGDKFWSGYGDIGIPGYCW